MSHYFPHFPSLAPEGRTPKMLNSVLVEEALTEDEIVLELEKVLQDDPVQEMVKLVKRRLGGAQKLPEWVKVRKVDALLALYTRTKMGNIFDLLKILNAMPVNPAVAAIRRLDTCLVPMLADLRENKYLILPFWECLTELQYETIKAHYPVMVQDIENHHVWDAWGEIPSKNLLEKLEGVSPKVKEAYYTLISDAAATITETWVDNAGANKTVYPEGTEGQREKLLSLAITL